MKIIVPDKNNPPSPELLEEIARLLAGPGGTVELTPDGWVYKNASAIDDE